MAAIRGLLDVRKPASKTRCPSAGAYPNSARACGNLGVIHSAVFSTASAFAKALHDSEYCLSSLVMRPSTLHARGDWASSFTAWRAARSASEG